MTYLICHSLDKAKFRHRQNREDRDFRTGNTESLLNLTH